MISPPSRATASARSSSPATAAVAGVATDGDEALVPPALDARLAALAARANTPEDEALERERQEFDIVTEIRAETQRELNTLRDMAMDQMKADDELLKKWIALI
jgi:hypothetical protein